MSDRAHSDMDLQDPLPESNWLWRRVFVFGVTAVLLFFMWGAVDRIGKVASVLPAAGIPALVTFSKWTISFAGLVVTYYLLAPSAEQMTKMMKTASLLKSGVQIAASRRSREPGKTVEEAATIGQPPQPPIPAPGAATAAPEAPVVPEPAPDAPGAVVGDVSEADIDNVRLPTGSYFVKGDQR